MWTTAPAGGTWLARSPIGRECSPIGRMRVPIGHDGRFSAAMVARPSGASARPSGACEWPSGTTIDAQQR
eukprot:6069523-Prymnesium_polylepis.1